MRILTLYNLNQKLMYQNWLLMRMNTELLQSQLTTLIRPQEHLINTTIYLNCREKEIKFSTVAFITAMINQVFMSSYLFLCSSNIRSFICSLVFVTIYGYITNLQSDQHLVVLIAQLVDHCTGIVEVMGSHPVQA